MIVPAGYSGASFALLTKHGKESVIQPLFQEALGATVELVGDFDTDTLGTFTREVPRAGSQLDAARRKAEMAIELSGLTRGLGSEGSFSPGPMGIFATNLELLIMIDRELGVEIAGVTLAPGHQSAGVFERWERLEEFAKTMLFPSHGLVLRPGGQADPRIFKECQDFDSLRRVFEECSRLSAEELVFAESDLRAHRNPTRMETIGKACEDLLQRLQCHCPRCARPGFGLSKKLPGLPCSWCGSPTNDFRGEEWKCPACGFAEERLRQDATSADPGHCPKCNP
jgi:ribosomal protein L37E